MPRPQLSPLYSENEWRESVELVPIIGREGRKEGNVYLMTYSTHFILRLYGVGHMVKDQSDSSTFSD